MHQAPPKPTTALCAILRNEIRGVVEWLAHYKALGVNDFLIYDNESDDGTAELLRALAEAGELTLIHWPHSVGERPQRLAYADARKRATADWLAFFDADEFLLLRQDADLGSFLQRFDDSISAVAISWVVFGSGGQQAWRPAPVTLRFVDALPPDAEPNRQIKAIGRRTRLVGTGIHRVEPAFGRYVTPSGQDAEFVGLTSVRQPDVAVAALHHYAVKSQQEFEEKRRRGHANSQNPGMKRERLDRALAAFDAGGVRNTDLVDFAPRMRAEALRLRDILLARGVSHPVWPFVEQD
jgi:Glycosyltransferase family 92